MRSFEERIAEIGRRSEKIYAQRRKRRRRILTVCVPLVLAGVCAALILPAGLKDGNNTEAERLNAEGVYMVPGTGSAEAWGTGAARQNYDSEEAERIIGLIDSIVSGPETDCEESMDFSTDENTAADGIGEKGYTVIVTRTDGTTTAYYLRGSVLTDRNTGLAFPMTEAELSALRDALGIA